MLQVWVRNKLKYFTSYVTSLRMYKFKCVSGVFQVCYEFTYVSGMFQVYVTRALMPICLQGLHAIFKGLSAICYKGFMPQVTRASCHMFQGPRATMFHRLYGQYAYVAGLGLRPLCTSHRFRLTMWTLHLFIHWYELCFSLSIGLFMYYYSLSPAHPLLCLFL